MNYKLSILVYKITIICILVRVLCAKTDAINQGYFKGIIGEEYEIYWMRKTPENISKEKYLVLFNVKSRIPEDAEEVLKDLDLEIEGKTQYVSKG